MRDNQQQWGSRTGLIFGLILVAIGLILALIWMQVPVDATDNEQASAPSAGAPPLYLPIINRLPDPVFPDWLIYVNRFREEGNVQLLEENEDWSQGGWEHGRYMVKNDVITHSQDPNNPWYTPDGHAAAQNGNVAVYSSVSASDEMAVDLWMTGPFHAIAILDPQLHTTGFGSYREADGGWEMGATLDVSRGRGSVPGGTSFPLTFPGDGGKTWLTQYGGNEWPDPLTSCPGYSAPSGPPIMIQIGSGNITPNVTASSFHQGGTPLNHCVFDETNYVNGDSGTQSTGRIILNNRDAIVIMPQAPLAVGQSYTASVTVNGTTHIWTFTVISPPTLEMTDNNGNINGR